VIYGQSKKDREKRGFLKRKSLREPKILRRNFPSREYLKELIRMNAFRIDQLFDFALEIDFLFFYQLDIEQFFASVFWDWSQTNTKLVIIKLEQSTFKSKMYLRNFFDQVTSPLRNRFDCYLFYPSPRLCLSAYLVHSWTNLKRPERAVAGGVWSRSLGKI